MSACVGGAEGVMKILGIDTTTKFFCLSVYSSGRIYEYNMELGRLHSKLIMVIIKRVLEALEWDAGDIDYFACGLGPGSFTGIRIGLATVKGFAWSLKKPVLGIGSLDILAMNAQRNGIIVPAIDAKRGLIYCSIYKNKDGILKRLAPYMLLSRDDFMEKARKGSILFGDAGNLYKEEILKAGKNLTVLDKDYWYPRGRNIIHLALEKIKEKKINNAFDIKPVYLYPKECQIKSLNKIIY